MIFNYLQDKIQYKVKWDGYDSDQNSWLDLEYMDCDDLILQYESQQT